jgi:hypothetical protein
VAKYTRPLGNRKFFLALAVAAAAVLGGRLGIHIHPDGLFDGP